MNGRHGTGDTALRANGAAHAAHPPRLTPMTRPLAFSVGLLAVAALTAGCARHGAAAAGGAGAAAGALPPARILVDGSNGVMPLAMALAESYRAVAPGVVVSFGEGLGSAARIEALARGRIDVALASHGLDTAALARDGMVAHRVALTPVVLGVHAAVPVRDITESQLCDVVAGRVTNWSSLGAGDLAIRAHVRPAAEVDSEVLRDGVPCMKGLAPGPAVHLAESTGDMARAISTTEGAVGVTTSTVVSRSGGTIRALSVGGVEPSASNVARGAYRLTRPSYLVTSARPSAAVSRFLAFVRGPRGADAIAATGSVPAR